MGKEMPYPRWAVATFSVVLTLLAGALAMTQLLNGVLVYENPHAIRDGQYFMIFGIASGTGFIMAIPAAVVAGVLVLRNPEFAPTLNQTLLVYLVVGMGLGMVLAWMAGGLNGLGWAVFGILLSLLGIVLAPLALFGFASTLPVSAPAGGVLLLAVLGAYGYYRRTQRRRAASGSAQQREVPKDDSSGTAGER
ncbi:MAG: hypothetical protein NZ874_04460 [Fimbriimonadales bacterium]|nr:hypothetical protein [Fimbriimonadales bacterium]